MAAPGIKISELTNYGDNISDISADLQRLFAAYGNDNCRAPLSTLNSKFIYRDFPAFETANPIGNWNYANVELSANNPQHPLDVTNGNTLSDLQRIFDRLSTIWKIREPFVNVYMPTISSVYAGQKWIIRKNKNRTLRYAGTEHGVAKYDAAWPTFPQTGVNTISAEGGYVFLKSENPGMLSDVYMNAGDEFTDEILSALGWNEDWPDDKELRLVRYEIKPSSPLGVTFHCAYAAYGADEKYAKKHSFRYVAHITVEYAGLTKTGTIDYFGGPKVLSPDCSPHRDNGHWGEGEPRWPDITGGRWGDNDNRNAHLNIRSTSGDVPGWHGIGIEIYDYCVRVDIQNVIITWGTANG